MRDVTEALELFDELTEEQKEDALAFLLALSGETRKGAS